MSFAFHPTGKDGMVATRKITMLISLPGRHMDDAKCSVRVGYWLWRPFYARLWWAAVPFYWAAMAASSRAEFLSAFYSSAFAGFANVFFFPPLVALILSYGFFKTWLARAEFDPDFDSDEHAAEYFAGRNLYGPSGMPREFDPLDQASGALWIGNPLNPLNGAYINRHPS